MEDFFDNLESMVENLDGLDSEDLAVALKDIVSEIKDGKRNYEKAMNDFDKWKEEIIFNIKMLDLF